jgi:hypothetical protein
MYNLKDNVVGGCGSGTWHHHINDVIIYVKSRKKVLLSLVSGVYLYDIKY